METNPSGCGTVVGEGSRVEVGMAIGTRVAGIADGRGVLVMVGVAVAVRVGVGVSG